MHTYLQILSLLLRQALLHNVGFAEVFGKLNSPSERVAGQCQPPRMLAITHGDVFSAPVVKLLRFLKHSGLLHLQ
jgi:hypothetical protein